MRNAIRFTKVSSSSLSRSFLFWTANRLSNHDLYLHQHHAVIRSSSSSSSSLSVALSVYFRNEALGMKEYEILSRATAFLIAVDPPPLTNSSSSSSTYTSSSKYKHIHENVVKQKSKLQKQDYAYEPAGGPPRCAEDLQWLEFCPTKFRPVVHVVASSHVLSPWLWKKYYPQQASWLHVVQQNQVQYFLDVFKTTDESKKKTVLLSSFPLQPFPIHHPAGLDIALVHLKEEEVTLPQLQKLGVAIHHLVDTKTLSFALEKVEEEKKKNHTETQLVETGLDVFFDGYLVTTDTTLSPEENNNLNHHHHHHQKTMNQQENDTRIFIPFTTTGNLIYTSSTRFLATTQDILPQGLCGGPVFFLNNINNNNNDNTQQNLQVLGMVEGIVPTNHIDPRMAGSAAFIPSFTIQEFINYAEQKMLQQILPKSLYDAVVDIKNGKGLIPKQQQLQQQQQQPYSSATTTNSSSSSSNNNKEEEEDNTNHTSISSMYHKNKKSSSLSSISTTTLDETFNDFILQMKQKLLPQQVEAVLATIERERQEVIDILQREGGDLDSVIEKVRFQTRKDQEKYIQELVTTSQPTTTTRTTTNTTTMTTTNEMVTATNSSSILNDAEYTDIETSSQLLEKTKKK